jgi:hypothetical protein
MLVRNLRKAGDYERAILSQEENLRMAIANDRNVSQAKAQARQGMLPELTKDQMRSKEEELTDAISIQGKALENLLSLYSKETAAKYMEGLSTDDMTYLNVYWNDLKPILKNKTGLSKTYFDRILRKHIEGITDNRGMSTVPSTGTKNASLNEIAEVKRLGLYFLRDSKIISKILGKLNILSGGRSRSKAAHTFYVLNDFSKSLPTQELLDKANKLPEAERQNWFRALIEIFEGVNPNMAAWEDALLSEGSETQRKVDQLFPILTEVKKQRLENLSRI